MTKLLFAITTLLLTTASLSTEINDARGGFWGDRSTATRGRFFYEHDRSKVKEKTPEKPMAAPSSEPYPYSKKMETYRKETDEIINKAILTLDIRDVAKQKERIVKTLRHARKFAEIDRFILINRPDLDESLRFPSNYNARELYDKVKQDETEKSIKRLSKTHYVFYFFKGSDKNARLFSKVMRRFANRHRIKLLAISLDGTKTQAFPNAIADQGQAKSLGLRYHPAVIAVPIANPKGARVLSYGHRSEMSLADNIFKVEQRLIEHNKRGF